MAVYKLDYFLKIFTHWYKAAGFKTIAKGVND